MFHCEDFKRMSVDQIRGFILGDAYRQQKDFLKTLSKEALIKHIFDHFVCPEINCIAEDCEECYDRWLDPTRR